jgi:acetolactate synthase I/II/III large subunit
MIRWKQAIDGFVDCGMTFNKPDFVAYAGAYSINSADGFASALKAAFAGGGVHLVTVQVDYSENTRVLVDELRARAIEKGTRP